jgi:hypothetical protein
MIQLRAGSDRSHLGFHAPDPYDSARVIHYRASKSKARRPLGGLFAFYFKLLEKPAKRIAAQSKLFALQT